MTTRVDVIAFARTLLGTRFKHQGRLPGVAIDCGGVLACTAAGLGLPHKDYRNYQRQPAPTVFDQVLRDSLDPIEGYGLAGDILTFNFVVQTHVAIVTSLDPLTILHAYEPYEKVLEHPVDDWWAKRARVWWSFRGLD